MAYDAQNWINGAGGGTALGASRLLHVENGLTDIANGLADVQDTVAALQASLDSGSGTGRVQVLTTAQRATFSAADGDQVWDTDVDALLTFVAGTWQKADGTAVTGGGGGNSPLNMAATVTSGGTIGAIVLTADPPATGTATSYKLCEAQ